jgi:ferredoxin-NADP reductase
VTTLQLLGAIVATLLIETSLVIAWVASRRHAGARPSVVTAPSRAVERSAWQGTRPFRIIRRNYEDRAQGQCSFHLAPVDGEPLPPFEAGQFVTVELELDDAQGGKRAVTRCYSLSDRHDPSAYRLTVKRILATRPELPAGLVSSYLHDRAAVGTVVHLRAPSGRFVLAEDDGVPSVLIAGGIGITPLLSIARDALERRPHSEVHLFYGTRNSRETAFLPELHELSHAFERFHLMIVHSRPDPDEQPGRDDYETGLIDVPLLRRVLPHGRHRFYLCGPPPMMASLAPALRAWGVSPGDLRYEAFGPASVASAEDLSPSPLTEPLEIRFTDSGQTLTWDGCDTNLLDLAERHGVVVQSGCRSGSCGTCETEIVSGEVDYVVPPSFDVAPRHCLLCVATPRTALVLAA